MAKDDQNYGQFVSVGLQMAVGVALGVIIGGWLDRRYGWSPWGVTVGSMLGLAAGMYMLIRDAIRMNKD